MADERQGPQPAGDEDRARDGSPPVAGRVPTGRAGRTARVGGLVAGQGARWAGTRAANRLRSPERAQEAERDRNAAILAKLVDQLSQMRGAAMKIGQMLTVELDDLPDEQERELREMLATLRDRVPPMPFEKIEKLLRTELGGPLGTVFSEFDEQAFAAASIGQVHRARTRGGDEVAVKVQYPGIAEAVDTDLCNAKLLLPLVRRLAPGLDAGAMAAEMSERIHEELDYELEAHSQRRIERLMRDEPLIHIPHVHTSICTRRVLVSEYVDGERVGALHDVDQQFRDAFGETVFRFFFGLAYRDRIALGDPHPGNYLWHRDGRVTFLDFGLARDLSAARVAAEAAIARSVRDDDPATLMNALIAAGYLPANRASEVEPEFALRILRHAITWYAVPGFRRFGEARADRGRERERERPDGAQREAAKRQINQFTIPPDAILLRRMHGLVLGLLTSLHAGADWGGIAAAHFDAQPFPRPE